MKEFKEKKRKRELLEKEEADREAYKTQVFKSFEDTMKLTYESASKAERETK